MTFAVQHAYHYPHRSSVDAGRLHLASSPSPSNDGVEPFLRAKVVEPRAVAMVMRLVSDVVRSRHHIPAAMLERILIEADPVLTWGRDALRVEGFSSCCGIYVRADIAASALETTEQRVGTTNVDFNDGMRGALGQIRDGDRFDLEVGDVGVSVSHDARGDTETVVERKVKLPLRWLKGFLEVQAIQSRMQPRLEFDRAGAVRFLRSLPRSGRSSDAAWVIGSGRSARLGSAKREGAVRVAGMSRLRTLEAGLPLIQRVAVHEDPITGASAWRLDGGRVTLSVVLSPETWRGFSGEGQALQDLAAEKAGLARVRAILRWQSELNVDRLAERTKLESDAVRRALARLGAHGLVGFDIARGAWFHRVLPFDLKTTRARIDAQHPRLKGARKLVESDAVAIVKGGDETQATVKSDAAVHRVRLSPGQHHCTCPWYAKHQGARGPCKHALAVELVLNAEARS